MDFASVTGMDNAEENKTEAEDDDNDDLVVHHPTPLGSKFGEAGERLRSARRRGRPASASGKFTPTFTPLSCRSLLRFLI